VGGRLTRFLNLEKRRAPNEEPPHEVVTKARFEGAESSGIGLEMDFGEQPFLRCPACEADNGRHAERCLNCQRPLQTEEVRAWNAAFWQKRKSEAPPPAPPLPPSVPLSPENRMLAEALAREVAMRERVRLSWWSSSGDDGFYDSRPLGLRLLQAIEDGRTRLYVGLGMAGAFVSSLLIAFKAKGHSTLQIGAALAAVLIATLFMPTRPRRWRWWD
jgi:hypothetical protein